MGTDLGDLSLLLITGAMTAYLIAMIAFATDLSRLRSGGDLERPRKAAGIAMSTLWLGAAVHLAGVVTRGIAAGRAPWANMYEFTITSMFVAAAVFLGIQRRRDVRYLGTFVALVAVLSLFLALAVLYVAPDGVMPALQSYWLVIHVSVAAAAMGVLAVAAVTSALQLVKDTSEARAARVASAAEGETTASVGAVAAASGADGSAAGAAVVEAEQVRVTVGARGAGSSRPSSARTAGGSAARGASPSRASVIGRRVVAALPSADELERFAYRLNAVGFVLWTFTLIAGAIWAEHAWGRYWGWDAKEVWTFVVWVVYAAYLHARSTRGWEGRRAAYFSLAGFASILINYYVVNFFFTSLHTYSGV